MGRTPRSSLKKHDAAAESRASKARRQRTTTQIRKDKRRETVQTKRRRLMSNDDIAVTGRSIAELMTILRGSDASHQEQYDVLREVRALLSAHENDYETVEQIIESGIVPVLVELLEQASPLATSTRTGGEVYKEILWCLTNIASGQYEHTKLVLPAVPRLLQFLEGSNATLAEHSAWVLGNIAADCEEFRQQLIKNGAVVPLTKQLTNVAEPELAKTSAWALSNIARGHETSAKAFIDAGIVPIVVTGLQQGTPKSFTEGIVVEIAWLLSFLTAREEEYLKLWLENGLIDCLLPYFATTNELLLTPILRVFGNICCGSMDHHTDEWQMPFVHHLLRSDSVFLPKLLEFIQPNVGASHAHLTAESAWVLSNLATLDVQVVDLLLHAGFLPLLVQHFHTGSYEVRREVAFVVTNVALTSPAHLEQVLSFDVLKGFLQLLSAADVAVVGNSLRLIENVLRVAPNGVSVIESHGGIEALENVQFQSQEAHLSQWAEALVNEFYGENYGINSPPSLAATGGALPEFSFQLPPPAPDAGRGRGAHMTMPAWKKG
ncbi:hypothetical protein Poli38472_001058 [Pythium oligandrum]|uniref:Importin subunit alpha n=1 Tax=Pythium oligandrum TaxID=41045 RepID=A0A8K1CS76_PYTOL|nr:hypothetical protein Poli38472_001058 [Pythium oligandrum]|eukprot:TMW68902.1 hypothetical protein Poli38472_001058 [Pythium oligandrum]